MIAEITVKDASDLSLVSSKVNECIREINKWTRAKFSIGDLEAEVIDISTIYLVGEWQEPIINLPLSKSKRPRAVLVASTSRVLDSKSGLNWGLYVSWDYDGDTDMLVVYHVSFLGYEFPGPLNSKLLVLY